MLYNQTQYGIKTTGVSASIPNHPVARLMYYFDSVCSLVPIDDGSLRKYRNEQNYMFLSRDEIDALVQITALVNPKVLIDECIFIAPQLCGNHKNMFFELSEVSNVLGISQNIIIGGKSTKVTKIMACRQQWLQQNFYNPLRNILSQREQEKQVVQINYIEYNERPEPQPKQHQVNASMNYNAQLNYNGYNGRRASMPMRYEDKCCSIM